MERIELLSCASELGAMCGSCTAHTVWCLSAKMSNNMAQRWYIRNIGSMINCSLVPVREAGYAISVRTRIPA